VGEPQAYDPEERPKPPNAPRRGIERADWLVGADEGLQAELDAEVSPEPPARPAPRLTRPGDSESNRPRPSGLFGPGVLPLRRPPAPLANAPEAKSTLPSWDRGASSVPTVRRSEHGPSSAPPELGREFPMDDAEERARIAAQAAEQQRQEAAIAARPHEVVAPNEFEIPVVAVPWWAEAPRHLLADRRVQLALGGLVLIVAVLALWPRGDRMISVAHLKQHPEQYADTQVRVSGRVAEVFPVGGSWAYWLVQGRDTIVVFSRTRVPRLRERVVVVGALSSGFLDGQSRVAIFESTH